MKGLLSLVTLLAAAATGVFGAELGIETTRAVECERKTKNGDSVHVHYRGTLASNGNEFDASYNRGKAFAFTLGQGRVIKGWDQGLLDMCIGEKRTLTVPPELGYGSRAVGSIPADSTLIFETELISIDGVEPPKVDTSSEVSEAAESATENMAAKIASNVAAAADAAKTFVADNDDIQEHVEL